jgi:chemotaxis protein CheX
MTSTATEIAALVVPFVSSVRTVFSTMVGIDISVRQPHLKSDPVHTYDISGIIGFSGGISGSVVLNFPAAAAAAIVQAFTGSPVSVDSPDFADAIGELANMVAGAAKTELGQNSTISTPTVVRGSGHSIAMLTDVPCIVIPCRTEMGEFVIEVNIKCANGAPKQGGN